jgi:hypothetical protein
VTQAARRVFRLVLAFWLAGWYCNAPGSPGFLRNFIDALDHSLVYDAFPALLCNSRLAFAVYLAPALAVVALVFPRERVAKASSVWITFMALIACLHLETCNDATFVTSFWVGLWLTWFVWRGRRDDADHYALARGLAHLVVGMVFLGGLVGKLTDAYRSGEAFSRLYFRDNPAWPYPALRARLSPDRYRALADWFSRGAISCETMMALAPILPTRVVVVVGSVTMLAMMVAWTFHLFSVLSCLFGLLFAAELLRREELRCDA